MDKATRRGKKLQLLGCVLIAIGLILLWHTPSFGPEFIAKVIVTGIPSWRAGWLLADLKERA